MSNDDYVDIKAFLHGYKPALTFTPHYIPPFYHPEDVKRLLTYPCIKGIQPHNKTADIYFQNEELKQSFQLRTKGFDHNEPEFHRILGETLGFPPLAADYFAKELQGLTDRSKRIGIEYNGINFIGSIDIMVECVKWLWDRYPQQYFRERDLEINYGRPLNVFQVDYNNVDKLRFIHEQISQLIKQASA